MTMLTDTLKVGIEVRRSPFRVALTFQALRSLDSLIGPPAGCGLPVFPPYSLLRE